MALVNLVKAVSWQVKHKTYLLADWFSNKEAQVADITNPLWGAPQGAAASLPANAALNAAAIQRMLDSGCSVIQLDGYARPVNTTLVYKRSCTIRGVGKSQTSLVWINADGTPGNDAPIIARPNWSIPNASGFNYVKIEDLRIQDTAARRGTYWSIDLTNGHSNGMYNSMLDCPVGTVASDRYGVEMGFTRDSGLASSSTVTFVAEFVRNRIVNGKLIMNTSDYYIARNELWGSNRDVALLLGFGGLVMGNEIVPGSYAGAYHFSDLGFDHDTMSYLGNYFDGSTNTSLITGTGIMSTTVGLRDANIVGNRFWFLAGSGVNVPKMYGVELSRNNFKDCDSDDNGSHDIVCPAVYGSTIANTHTRSVIAPKTGATRVNPGSIWNVAAVVGFPPSILDATANVPSAYANPAVANTALFDIRGAGSRTAVTRTTVPLAGNFPGKSMVINGRLMYSTGSAWVTVNPAVGNQTTALDLDAAPEGPLSIPDPTICTNIPGGLTGDCLLETWTIADDANFKIQRLTKCSTGKMYMRKRISGTWASWASATA